VIVYISVLGLFIRGAEVLEDVYITVGLLEFLHTSI